MPIDACFSNSQLTQVSPHPDFNKFNNTKFKYTLKPDKPQIPYAFMHLGFSILSTSPNV